MLQARWRPIMVCRVDAAVRIQAAARAVLARRRFVLMRETAVKLQESPIPIPQNLAVSGSCC